MLHFLLVTATLAPIQQAVHGIDTAAIKGCPQIRPLTRPMSYADATASAPSFTAISSSGGSTVAAATTTSTLIPLAQGLEADMPLRVEISAPSNTAVVVCRDSDSLEFHDAISGARLGQVFVDDEPVDLVLTPDGSKALVPCIRSDTLCIVDVATRTVLARVSNVGVEPYKVLVSANGAEAVVGSIRSVGNPTQGRFTRVDIATGTVIGSTSTAMQAPLTTAISAIMSDTVFTPFGITPDAKRVVFGDYWSFSVRVLDLVTGVELMNIGTGLHGPTAVDVAANGLTAVVASARLTGGIMPGLLTKIDLSSLTSTSFPLVSGVYFADVRVLANGGEAILGTNEGLRIVDLATGAETNVSSDFEYLAKIELAPNGNFALTSMFDAKLVDLTTKMVVSTLPTMVFLRAIAFNSNSTRAVALRTWVDESLYGFAVNGPTVSHVGTRALGETPDVDAPLDCSVSADGRRAALMFQMSYNIGLVDLEHQAIVRVVPIRARPADIAVNATGSIAVVACADPFRVSVVDLDQGLVLREIALSGEPAQVLLSSDGQRAFVLSRASNDTVITFLDVAGAATQSTGTLSMGSAACQAMFLSPANDTLGVSHLLPGYVAWIDTAAQSITRTVSIADFALDGSFTPDGQHIAFTSWSGLLSYAEVYGASTSAQLISVGGALRNVRIDAAGRYAYVPAINPGGSGMSVRVVDLQTSSVVLTIPLPGSTTGAAVSHFPILAERLGDRLLVGESENLKRVWRLRLAGPATVLEQDIPALNHNNFSAVSWSLGSMFIPMPTEEDALLQVRLGGSATEYCAPATPNSTGLPSRLSAYGTFIAGEQPLRMRCEQLPPNKVALLLVGTASGSTPIGQGHLCVSGNVARFSNSVASSGSTGVAEFDVDIQALPYMQPVAIQPGETWYFQVWHRDFTTAPTTNFSSAVAVTYE
jgi:YVTN family beta-propeller protein